MGNPLLFVQSALKQICDRESSFISLFFFVFSLRGWSCNKSPFFLLLGDEIFSWHHLKFASCSQYWWRYGLFLYRRLTQLAKHSAKRCLFPLLCPVMAYHQNRRKKLQLESSGSVISLWSVKWQLNSVRSIKPLMKGSKNTKPGQKKRTFSPTPSPSSRGYSRRWRIHWHLNHVFPFKSFQISILKWPLLPIILL